MASDNQSAPEYTIQDATLHDASMLAPLLRWQDIREIRASSGEQPLHSLLEAVSSSHWSKCVRIDGSEVSALFGVTPLPRERVDNGLDDITVGVPWLLCAPSFLMKVRRGLVREGPYWVDEMQKDFDVLVNFIDCRNTAPMYWLEKLGFQFTKLWTRWGAEKTPFIQFERTT